MPRPTPALGMLAVLGVIGGALLIGLHLSVPDGSSTTTTTPHTPLALEATTLDISSAFSIVEARIWRFFDTKSHMDTCNATCSDTPYCPLKVSVTSCLCAYDVTLGRVCQMVGEKPLGETSIVQVGGGVGVLAVVGKGVVFGQVNLTAVAERLRERCGALLRCVLLADGTVVGNSSDVHSTNKTLPIFEERIHMEHNTTFRLISYLNPVKSNDKDEDEDDTLLFTSILCLTAVFLLLLLSIITAILFSIQSHVLRVHEVLQIEGIDVDNRCNPVEMLQSMHVALYNRLLQYKGCVPYTSLVESEGEEDDEEEVVHGGGTTLSVPEAPPPHRQGSGRGGFLRERSREHLKPSLSSAKLSACSLSSGSLTSHIAAPWKTKTVTTIWFNVCSSHKRHAAAPTEFQAELLDIMSTLAMATTSCGGLFDLLAGDHMLSVYNAFVSCTQHRLAAFTSVTRAKKDLPCEVSFSVCSGPASVGRMGCSTLRQNGVFATAIAFGAALERLNCTERWGGVVDQFALEGGLDMRQRYVAAVYSAKRHHKAVLVSIFTECLDAPKDEEWMYQVQHLEDNDVAHNVNSIWAAVMRCEWRAAHERLCTEDATEGRGRSLVSKALRTMVVNRQRCIYLLDSTSLETELSSGDLARLSTSGSSEERCW